MNAGAGAGAGGAVVRLARADARRVQCAGGRGVRRLRPRGLRGGRSGQATAVPRAAHAGFGSRRGVPPRVWHRRRALQDRDRECSLSPPAELS